MIFAGNAGRRSDNRNANLKRLDKNQRRSQDSLTSNQAADLALLFIPGFTGAAEFWEAQGGCDGPALPRRFGKDIRR